MWLSKASPLLRRPARQDNIGGQWAGISLRPSLSSHRSAGRLLSGLQCLISQGFSHTRLPFSPQRLSGGQGGIKESVALKCYLRITREVLEKHSFLDGGYLLLIHWVQGGAWEHVFLGRSGRILISGQAQVGEWQAGRRGQVACWPSEKALMKMKGPLVPWVTWWMEGDSLHCHSCRTRRPHCPLPGEPASCPLGVGGGLQAVQRPLVYTGWSQRLLGFFGHRLKTWLSLEYLHKRNSEPQIQEFSGRLR